MIKELAGPEKRRQQLCGKKNQMKEAKKALVARNIVANWL